ncbi:uncharacterized protein LOC142091073 isoform X1 [Calonectris borealis]|uniref:uncharacterized protein LOC142091073 isoform X1 n=1 Tax=Calonectris borealis TaxID=1323832 RepID=UPI003F4C8020
MLALLQHLRSTRRRGGHLPEDVIAALQGAEERTLPSGCWYRVGAVGVLELDLYIREGSGSRLEGDVWRLPLLPRPAGCRLLLGDAVSCYGHMHMTAKRVPSPSRRLSRGLAVNTVQWLTSLVALEAPLCCCYCRGKSCWTRGPGDLPAEGEVRPELCQQRLVPAEAAQESSDGSQVFVTEMGKCPSLCPHRAAMPSLYVRLSRGTAASMGNHLAFQPIWMSNFFWEK